jgi:3-phosphoshikimate 1-carboxyvinyltransferase
MKRRNVVTLCPPLKGLEGRITLPGSKSVTNRALLLASLAQGTSRLRGALTSDDTIYMAEGLRRMGVNIVQDDQTSFTISDSGKLQPPSGALFLGNAGTAMRFLVGAATLVEGVVTVDGNEHMRRRPIGGLVTALNTLGVEARDTLGCPPVTIHGSGSFSRDVIEVDGALSSQFVSAIMMAAACNSKPLVIRVPGREIGGRGYIDIMLSVMAAFGASIQAIGPSAWRIEPTGYHAREYSIEADASAATYLWAAEKLTDGHLDLGTVPAEMAQPDAKAHAVISMFPNMPSVIDGGQMQDAVPTLAVLSAFNNSPVRFTGISNLRVKECDRITAVATELSRIMPGLAREEGDDLVVFADPTLAGRTIDADIETYSDHRIAMSFSLAGLRIHGIKIRDPDCASKTYPKYWDDLASVGVGLLFE